MAATFTNTRIVIRNFAFRKLNSRYSTYKILARLEQHNLVECRYNLASRFWVWQLTEYGFTAIKEFRNPCVISGIDEAAGRVARAFRFHHFP